MQGGQASLPCQSGWVEWRRDAGHGQCGLCRSPQTWWSLCLCFTNCCKLEPACWLSRARRTLVKAASQCIEIDRTMLGRGYGWPCDGRNAAMALANTDGSALDTSYTAKVIAALLATLHQQGPALYSHTLAAPQVVPAGGLTLPRWYDGSRPD